MEWGLTHVPDLATVEFGLPAASSGDGNGGEDGAAALPAPRHVLLLGSDGFFDAISMVQACVTALAYTTAAEAADALVDAAVRRWAVETQGIRADDITLLVAFLPA